MWSLILGIPVGFIGLALLGGTVYATIIGASVITGWSLIPATLGVLAAQALGPGLIALAVGIINNRESRYYARPA